MRSPMPQPLVPALLCADSPDSFGEVVLEVNGRELGRTVFDYRSERWFEELCSWWQGLMARRC